MSKKVVIIDYKLGNLFSVIQACESVGLNAFVSHKPEDITNADAMILPGVGAFPEAVSNLHELNLFDSIVKEATDGKPLFGICLGLQLLFTESKEFELSKGLNLIEGTIEKFDSSNDLKVPHVGWNEINKAGIEWGSSPLKGIKEREYMYFVHSYFVAPKDNNTTLTTTDYSGNIFCSSVMKNNIFATQFHPEKSAAHGIEIYNNWAKSNKLI